MRARRILSVELKVRFIQRSHSPGPVAHNGRRLQGNLLGYDQLRVLHRRPRRNHSKLRKTIE